MTYLLIVLLNCADNPIRNMLSALSVKAKERNNQSILRSRPKRRPCGRLSATLMFSATKLYLLGMEDPKVPTKAVFHALVTSDLSSVMMADNTQQNTSVLTMLVKAALFWLKKGSHLESHLRSPASHSC